jgi:hypothetical protein
MSAFEDSVDEQKQTEGRLKDRKMCPNGTSKVEAEDEMAAAT